MRRVPEYLLMLVGDLLYGCVDKSGRVVRGCSAFVVERYHVMVGDGWKGRGTLDDLGMNKNFEVL